MRRHHRPRARGRRLLRGAAWWCVGPMSANNRLAGHGVPPVHYMFGNCSLQRSQLLRMRRAAVDPACGKAKKIINGSFKKGCACVCFCSVVVCLCVVFRFSSSAGACAPSAPAAVAAYVHQMLPQRCGWELFGWVGGVRMRTPQVGMWRGRPLFLCSRVPTLSCSNASLAVTPPGRTQLQIWRESVLAGMVVHLLMMRSGATHLMDQNATPCAWLSALGCRFAACMRIARWRE